MTELSRFSYCSRVRIDGSIASARRAGIHVARRPSDDIAPPPWLRCQFMNFVPVIERVPSEVCHFARS